MAFKLSDLNNPDKVKKYRETIHKINCRNCGVVIRSAVTGKNKVGDKILCDDCYYGELGDEIEQRPIFNPSRF